jgi:hypothetical protein
MMLVLALPILAAATIVHFFPPQIYQHDGNLNIYAQHLTTYAHPNAETLNKIARGAPYRVIFPKGLPVRTEVSMAAVADSELIDVSYSCPGRRVVDFVIAPKSLSSLLHPLADPHKHVAMHPRVALPWRTFAAGDEIVRIASNCLTQSEVTRVREAMQSAGAAKY